MLKIKFGKQATKIEAWGLLQLGVCKNLANLLIKEEEKERKKDVGFDVPQRVLPFVAPAAC